MIAPTTAMSAPGIFLLTRSRPRIVPRTATDTTSVGTLVSVGIACRVFHELLERGPGFRR